MSDAPARHTVAGAVAGAFRRSPRNAKIYFAAVTLYVVFWVGMSLRGGISRPPVVAGFLAALAGMMVGYSTILFRVAQGDRWRGRMHWGIKPRQLNEMLLALPAFNFTAGALAAAATVVIFGSVRKSPWVLLFAAVTVWLVAMSGKVLMDTTRFLYVQAREQAAAAERARAEATGAQLAALQAQVNPHFLFNALNTIAALVRTDARAAESTTENLAHVLRRTLDRSRRTECTVEDEIDYMRAWLAVERERFGERLRVDFEVEPGVESLRIPTMALQPLVENSLKHGIAGKLEGGRVVVRALRSERGLRLEVEDDGAGFVREAREGTGLGNLRRRLETIYGDAAELRIERPDRGARVVIELPTERPAVPVRGAAPPPANDDSCRLF